MKLKEIFEADKSEDSKYNNIKKFLRKHTDDADGTYSKIVKEFPYRFLIDIDKAMNKMSDKEKEAASDGDLKKLYKDEVSDNEQKDLDKFFKIVDL